MKHVAILDNTVLANFIDSGLIAIFEKLRSIFNHFLIPVEVQNEFLKVISMKPLYQGFKSREALPLAVLKGTELCA